MSDNLESFRLGWNGTKWAGVPRPYIYVTWLTKLLAGEDKCWYKSWYKAHFKYEKRDDDERAAFLAAWTEKHDALVKRRVEELRKQGWVVKVEEDGEFKLEGKLGDLVGKPDYVAMKDGVALVGDGKSGKERESDHWQVLIYEFALPLSWLRCGKCPGCTSVPQRACTGWSIEGEVEYQTRRQPVRPLTDASRKNIVEAIQRIAGPAELSATPSITECRFCDILKCKFRKEPEKRPEGDATGYF